MKHHFADLLDRTGDYWSITPNRERWACHFADLSDAPADITRVMINKRDRNWRRAETFANLSELTFHEPSQEQLAAISNFSKVTALRLSHARPKTLEILEKQTAVRELVLEYVSGVKDLKPIGALPAVEALHLENLRGVSDFSGLSSAQRLRYLSIDGTLDWSQPVESFGFLAGLHSLEYLRFGFIRAPKGPFPLLRSCIRLKKLKRLEIGMATFPLEEFAWIEANLSHVEGAVRPPYIRYGGKDREITPPDYRARMSEKEFKLLAEAYTGTDGKRYERVPLEAMLLGKGVRNVLGTEEHVMEKCISHEEKYRRLVGEYANQ
jgi:hypothetical protein